MAKRLALLIANSKYIDPTLNQLIAPTHDAKGLADVLGNPNIGNFEVRTLLDESTQKLREEIEDFFGDDRSKDDLLLLYLSCHGIRGQDGQLYYATYNTSRKRLKSTSIEASYVNNLMSSCRALTQILLLDCCHSGAFAKGFTFKSEDSKDIHTNQYFEVNNSSRGKLVITASDAIQYALEGDNTIKKTEDNIVYSVFTEALVHGLESGEADLDVNGVVTYDELYDYVSSQVKQQTPQQTPRKWGFDSQGQVIIAKNPKRISKDPRKSKDPQYLLTLLQDNKIEEFNKTRESEDIPLILCKLDLSEKILTGANLQEADLRGTKLTKTKLSSANLKRSNLRDADLNSANLIDATLEEADLTGAKLINAKLNNAYLKRAKLVGSDLTGAELERAELYGVNLSEANLTGAVLRGACLKGMIDFSRANLTGAVLRGADLSGKVDFTEAILRDADFTGCIIDNKWIDWTGADPFNAKGLPAFQGINEYVESLKAFSNDINQQFKTYNIPKEELKPIEESIIELRKEVENITQKPDKVSSMKKKNLNSKFIDIVNRVIDTLPKTNEQTLDLFGSLNSFEKLIGQEFQKIVQNTIAQKEKENIEKSRRDYTEQGGKLLNSGKYKEAIESYDEALKIIPDDFEVIYYKGLAFFNLTNYEEAIKYFEQCLNLNPEYPKALEYKELAIKKLEKYKIEANPKSASAMSGLPLQSANPSKKSESPGTRWFKILSAVGRDAAEPDVDKSVSHVPFCAPKDHEAVIKMLQRTYETELPEQRSMLQTIQDQIESADLQRMLAAQLDPPEEVVVKSCNETLKRDPNNVEALIKKGEALNKLGKFKEAEKSYKKAFEIDPKHAAEFTYRNF
jgi:uncharacterized protein YjbI with pentapeptide repeats/uncharacterized caspase-like protein/Tfp pilus assembly protein PilF